MKRFYSLHIVLCLSVFLCSTLYAQATTNAYSSVVNPEQQGLEYRAAFTPEEGNRPSRFRERIHYQRPFKEHFRWRGIIQGSDTINGELELEWFQAELQWQIRNTSSHGWDSALRFDARISKDGINPDRFGLNWSNQFSLGGPWQARAILLTTRDIGSRARSGVLIRTWTQLRYRLENGANIALEMFNSYGRTPSFGVFDKQKHQIGPAFTGRFRNGLSYNVGMLFGVSKAASDLDLRVFLSKSF